MGKATICLMVTMCSVIAFAQEEPQWKVVQHVTLFQQSELIYWTTLLTPTEPGVYRLTVYFSGGGGGAKGQFVASIHGFDITGIPLGLDGIAILCSGKTWYQTAPITVSLKPQIPLMYEVLGSNNGTAGCQYNLAITVEQLMQ